MEIINIFNSKRLERKLDNGLTEVKEFWENEQLKAHYFVDEKNEKHGEYKLYYNNGKINTHCFYKDDQLHGEYKWYWFGRQALQHLLYENGKLMKDFLHGNN